MNVYSIISSPLGPITIQTNSEGILGLWFDTCTTKPEILGEHDPENPLLQECAKQLTEYFALQRQQFNLPLAAQGTPFQQAVWHALTLVPFGETSSYQDIAIAIGKPSAVRAVGTANGKNPISIIVPCHRVIGKNGKLTGYAGGVERKQKLLELEGIQLSVDKTL